MSTEYDEKPCLSCHASAPVSEDPQPSPPAALSAGVHSMLTKSFDHQTILLTLQEVLNVRV